MILFYAQIKKKKKWVTVNSILFPSNLKGKTLNLTLPCLSVKIDSSHNTWMNHTPHKTFVAPFVAENYCKLFLRELRKL